MKIHRLSVAPAGTEMGIIEVIGASCTCWPDITTHEHPGMGVEVRVLHNPGCARLDEIRPDPKDEHD